MFANHKFMDWPLAFLRSEVAIAYGLLIVFLVYLAFVIFKKIESKKRIKQVMKFGAVGLIILMLIFSIDAVFQNVKFQYQIDRFEEKGDAPPEGA